MSNLAIPIELAAITAAVGWPFAAGLGIVFWSKARAAARQRKLQALDAGLKSAFNDVASKPVPERLAVVIEALEEAEAMRSTVAPIAPKGSVPVG